jgi:hypothetical protein
MGMSLPRALIVSLIIAVAISCYATEEEKNNFSKFEQLASKIFHMERTVCSKYRYDSPDYADATCKIVHEVKEADGTKTQTYTKCTISKTDRNPRGKLMWLHGPQTITAQDFEKTSQIPGAIQSTKEQYDACMPAGSWLMAKRTRTNEGDTFGWLGCINVPEPTGLCIVGKDQAGFTMLKGIYAAKFNKPQDKQDVA